VALKTSTGLRDSMLTDSSFKTIMDGGLIKIYSGTAPSTADDSIGSATLLLTISDNDTGTGIDFDTTASSGTISKDPGQTWSGTIASTGTPTFYRHVASGDTGGASTTEARLQGTVGTAGADMNFADINFIAAATRSLTYYSVALPTF